jgi:carbon monoxide dehydrogenase subunit G
VLVEGTFELLVPRAVLYQRLLDARLLAQCIPGCEALERLDEARYKAGVAFTLAGIKARFDLIVELTQQDPPGRIVCVTRGEEGSLASQLSAESEITLHELAPLSTRVQYVSEVSITGPLGRFGLGVMKKKAQAMGDEFVLALREALAVDHG